MFAAGFGGQFRFTKLTVKVLRLPIWHHILPGVVSQIFLPRAIYGHQVDLRILIPSTRERDPSAIRGESGFFVAIAFGQPDGSSTAFRHGGGVDLICAAFVVPGENEK